MAYYLQFDGVNDSVLFDTPINIPAANSDSFAYVWDIYYDGTADQVLYADPSSFNDSIRITDSSTIIFRGGSSSRTFSLTTPLSVGRQIIKLKKDVFNGSFYDENDNLLSPVQSFGVTNTVHGFGAESVSARKFSGKLYGCKIYSDFNETVLVHNYDPSLSNGTGSVLIDSVGGNNGTLVNFPTDDSQWVFYDDGGGATTTQISETAQQFTASLTSNVVGNVTVLFAESAQPFTSSLASTVISNISASIIEQSQAFTSALISSVSPAGVTTVNMSESAQPFASSLSSVIIGNVSITATELAQPFDADIGVDVFTFINVTMEEIAPQFTSGLLLTTPTKWIDKVTLNSEWSDKTKATNTWFDK